MATPADDTTTTNSRKQTRKTSTRKTTASTAPRKTTKKTTKKTASRSTGTTSKTTASSRKRTSARRPSANRAAAGGSLLEREPAALLETASYAATSVVNDVVTLVRSPQRREQLEERLASLRERLGQDLERTLTSFTRAVDARAAEGKKVVEVVVKDERVARVLDQTSATRAQVKAALTSVTRTADVTTDAASKQAGTARSRIKGATTTVRNSSDQVRSQVKGAATSVRRIADVTYDAASRQAPNAVSQVKGAATSVRKSAETIVEAAADTASDAERQTRG